MSELRKTLRAEAEEKLDEMRKDICLFAAELCAETSVDVGLLLNIVSGTRNKTLVSKAITALANDAEADLLSLHKKGSGAKAVAFGDRVNASSVTKS